MAPVITGGSKRSSLWNPRRMGRAVSNRRVNPRALISSGALSTFAAGFHTQITGKVIPLKEGLHDLEAAFSEELDIFAGAVGDQDILESFPLAANFRRGVFVALLEVVVKLDEEAVHLGVVGEG